MGYNLIHRRTDLVIRNTKFLKNARETCSVPFNYPINSFWLATPTYTSNILGAEEFRLEAVAILYLNSPFFCQTLSCRITCDDEPQVRFSRGVFELRSIQFFIKELPRPISYVLYGVLVRIQSPTLMFRIFTHKTSPEILGQCRNRCVADAAGTPCYATNRKTFVQVKDLVGGVVDSYHTTVPGRWIDPKKCGCAVGGQDNSVVYFQ